MNKIKIGFALCGSFCTFNRVLPEIERLVEAGYEVYPIMSGYAFSTDTRFGEAAEFVKKVEDICGKAVIHTINDAEPIGPKALLDALIVAPCTGNTLGKLASGITDTSVTIIITLLPSMQISAGGTLLQMRARWRRLFVITACMRA